MSDIEYEPGDEVDWDTSQGPTQGTVVRRLTKETHIKGHVAKATAEEPQYLVRSDSTGAEAAHHPDELRRR